VVHVQKKPKGLLLKNIVGTVKKSYAQNALNGIYGGRHFDLAALICFIINDFFCFSNF
jgi:hypothetical protein